MLKGITSKCGACYNVCKLVDRFIISPGCLGGTDMMDVVTL